MHTRRCKKNKLTILGRTQSWELAIEADGGASTEVSQALLRSLSVCCKHVLHLLTHWVGKLAHSQWVGCHRDVSGWGLPATVTLPPLLNPAPGEQWLLVKFQEATERFWVGTWHGMFILDRSCWGLCVKDGFDMDKTEAKVMTFHQRGGGKRKRIRDWERHRDTSPHPPRKGVKIQMCQLGDRESEKGDIRKAQGRSQHIQYGLNHSGIHSKVHMSINPCRIFRTFLFFTTWSVKWRVTVRSPGLHFLP